MGTESSLTPTVPCMRANGVRISNTVKELNHGILIESNIQEILSMAKKRVQENLNLRVATTKANFLTANFMESENIILQIQENYMKVNSVKIIWTAKV